MPIDLDLFRQHMRAGGLVEAFLRGHLWVESFLVELLEAELRDPKVMRLDRMPFSAKVDLAQGVGMMSAGEAAPLRILNRLRNRLAHDLSGEPTEQDLVALESSLTELQRKMFDTLVERRPDADGIRRLEHVVHVIVATIEAHRQRHVWWKENKEALDIYGLISELQRQTGGGPSTDVELRQRYGVPDPPNPLDVWIRHEAESDPSGNE